VGEGGADIGELLEVDGGTRRRRAVRWCHAREEGGEMAMSEGGGRREDEVGARGRRAVRWWRMREEGVEMAVFEGGGR
jgi:hypothetical protein